MLENITLIVNITHSIHRMRIFVPSIHCWGP